MSFDISQHFDQYFSLKVANTEELLNEVYRIRYEVYCEELQYESPENFSDGLEKDICDKHSINCLLQHKSTGTYAGCVRLILPPNKSFNSTFPWKKFASSITYPYSDYQWDNIGEISRLAVRSQFRKRKEDGELPVGSTLPSNSNRRRFPLITMSLYWAAACLALNSNLDLFAIMQPRLARHLQKCGLRYSLISDLFDFHGERGIFLIKSSELIENLEPNTYDFFCYINNIIVEGLPQLQYIRSPLDTKDFESLNKLVQT